MVQITAETRNKTRKKSGALAASPSGIDELPLLYQASIFFGTYALLGISTLLSVRAIDSLSKSVIGLEKWRNGFVDTSLPILLGLFYFAAGYGHFVSAEAFQDIYPPRGTWGLWYVPGSAQFHVAWTGVVEMLGGSGLLFSGARCLLGMTDDDDESWVVKLLQPSAASALFFLTVLVTPANIYMWTHGALMGDMEPLAVSFHYIRFAVQVVFLSLLAVLAKDSFFFAWGDELD
ncbi:hypothetical protein ACHAXT_001559 [Thalassiosira profunda]